MTLAADTAEPSQQTPRVERIGQWIDALVPQIEPLVSLCKPFVDGLEHLPPDGRFLLVGNHTPTAIETLLIPYELRRRLGLTVRPLAHHMFGYFTGLPADILAALGAVVGTPEGTRALMRANQPILVFPGGERDVGKAKDELYRVLWGKRDGFARLAIEHDYPIVPAALVGGDDVYKILTTRHGTWGRLGSEVGRRLHGRTDMTPHLIRGIGPTLIPRPQRMYLRFGPPIDTAAPDGVATEQWVATVKETAKAHLESTLADLLRVRETDPYRHLAPWAWQRAVMPAPPG